MIEYADKWTNLTNIKPNDATPHGLTPNQIQEMQSRFENFTPGIATRLASVNNRNLLGDSLPEGATWDPRTRTAQALSMSPNSTGAKTMNTVQTPYQPEYASPDRQMYPIHRILANRYWRLFYKLDPIIGNCIEMFSSLPWSNFELCGDGVEGEIKQSYEYMCRETQILALLPYFVQEFLIVGEVAPHCFFSSDKGVFTHIAMHNPDQLEVIDAPFIKMDPIVEFIPDDRLRSILTSSNPSLRTVREKMPPELLSRLQSRQNIPLSPVNATFIPRKLHPYDTRGTSIISRMWRILMYEDCFVGDSKVVLANGTVKPICEVREGEEVINKEGGISIVEKQWEEAPPSKLCEIKIQGNDEVFTTTLHHKYPVFALPRTCCCGCGGIVTPGNSHIANHVKGKKIDWVGYNGNNRWNIRFPKSYDPYQKLEAQDIHVGDYLMIPRKFKEVPTADTLEYARLLGYYLAEGCDRILSSEDNGIRWSLCLDERDTIAVDIVNICNKLGHDAKINVTPSNILKNGCTVSLQKHEDLCLANKIRSDGGKYADKKQLSNNVMSWPLGHKKQLIKGYILGDGHCRVQYKEQSHSNSFSIKVSSISIQLINQIRLVLAQLGVFAAYSCVPYSKRSQSDGCNRKDQWVLSIQGPSLDILWEIVNGDKPPRQNIEKTPSRTWMDDNFIYIPVESVNIVDNIDNKPVYNLTVSDDHSYLVNQVGTYNSIFNTSINIAKRNACFIAGTKVLMSSGLKNIEDVNVGDKVISGNGSVQTVEAAWQEQPSKTITIKALGTDPLTCTLNHNFLIWKTPRVCACGCGQEIKRHKGYISAFVNSHNSTRNSETGRIEQVVKEWKEWSKNPKLRTSVDYIPIQKVPASEIRPYDYLLIPRKFEEIKPDCTLNQARLLGYYIAEGNIKFNQAVFSFGEDSSLDEHKFANDVIDICREFGIDAVKKIKKTESQRLTGRQPTIVINTLDSKNLCQWLVKHGGQGAPTKILSEEVMRWPLEFKKELIKGLFRGDGSRSKCSGGNSYQVAMGLTSQTVISQIRLIFAQFGVFSSISFNPKKIRHPDWNDTWIISSTGADARLLRELIWNEHISSPWGEECRKGMKTWIDDNYIYVPVQSVKENLIEVPVYNLTVSNDHSYIANSVQTLNSPLKVAKLGNAQTGWIPPPEQEKKLLELLAQAELDPCAWIVYHYGIQFELVGSQERAMSISREWETIERIKLIALGISKSFLSGEVSYSSAAVGLQLFQQRLKSMRLFFEQKWIYPKFFKPIAEINGWIKPKPAEVAHHFRVKRSAQELEEQNMYIIPKIVWDKSLDPQVNSELIQSMTALENLGVKFSKTSKMAAVGYSFEEEVKKIHRENEYEKAYLPKLPGDDQPKPEGGPALGGGAPKLPSGGPPEGGDKDKIPPGGPPGTPPPGGVPPPGGPPPPGGAPKASVEADKEPEMAKDKTLQEMDAPKPEASSYESLKSKIWIDDKCGNWHAQEVRDLVDLISTLDTESAFWSQLGQEKEFKKALLDHDNEAVWNCIEDYLEGQSYPNSDIDSLREIMEAEGIMSTPASLDRLKQIEAAIPENADDIAFANAVARTITGNKITKDDNFLVGQGSLNVGSGDLLGDISGLIGVK